MIEREAAGTAPDPGQIVNQLTRAGLDPKIVLDDAQFAFERARYGVKLDQLGAHALAQLAVFGAHLRKHAVSRP